jgi:hypothetical protein
MEWNEIQRVLQEMIQMQTEHTWRCGRVIVPTLTEDDMLQPNDFPELENHPHFRYEEGLLAGLHSALVALQAEFRTTK